MDKAKNRQTSKQHQTVVIEKNNIEKQKYSVIEEIVIINSDEIIN